jgi:hypothetical protein
MSKTIARVYDDYASAERAVARAKAAGLKDSDTSILASNADGWHKPHGHTVAPTHDKDRDGRDDRAEGAAVGGGLGAVAGGAVGAAVGLGMLAIPGIGPVVAAGWLATLVAGAVAGGAAGGLIGALVESGVSKENAELYAEAVRRGGVIVTAKVPDDEEAKYSALLAESAIDVDTRAKAWREEGWKGFDPNDGAYDVETIHIERKIRRG